MPPIPPALHVASATAAAALLAIAALLPTGPAAADSTEPSSATTPGAEAPAEECGLVCLPILSGRPEPTDADRPTHAQTPAHPDNSTAAAPAGPQQPAVSPAPVEVATESSAPDAAEETAADGANMETVAAGTGPAPSHGPSRTSNWDTPATTSVRATKAAVASRTGGIPGGPDLPAIAAGVLLVGVGGGSFAWWNRNRLRMH